MNYPLRTAILDWLSGKGTVTHFAERVENLLVNYARENAYAMYLLLGSHDTERVWTVLGGNLAKVKLAFLFEFTYPGATAVYYGDEIGMEGGKDPACRHTFNWDASHWRTEIRDWVQRLIQIRKNQPVMRRGEFKRVWLDDKKGCYAYARTLGDTKALIVINAGGVRRHLRLPIKDLGWRDGQIVHNQLESEDFIITGDQLNVSISGWTGMIIG